MSRGYMADYLESLHNRTSVSVVQLSVCKQQDNKQYVLCHHGTGLVVSCHAGFFGVITTVSCDPASGYEVFTRFENDTNIKVHVVVVNKIFSGLIIKTTSLDDDIVPVREDSFDDKIIKSEPVWTVGSFGKDLENIMTAGHIGVINILKYMRGIAVETFMHSCPIGDGLIGAPVINQLGKIIGINVALTQKVANVNHAIGIEVIKSEIAQLINGNSQESLGSLLEKFGHTLFDMRPKEMKLGPAGLIFKRSRKRKDQG